MNPNPAGFQKANRVWLISIGLVVLLAAAGWLVYYWMTPPTLEVTYIDVCHSTPVGDSILLQSSDGKTLLIDGGEKGSGALDYLTTQGITHIDTIVLTHAHDDHFGGLIEVLHAIPVDEVVTNGETIDEPSFLEFESTVRESGARQRVVKSGDRLRFGRLTFQILSPEVINPDSINNNSIVMRLLVGDVTFLFTGDTMRLEEERLIASGAVLQADILKIAHHGIDTSSSGEFLVRVKPEVAVYCVNANNPYGSPNPKLLEDMRNLGVEMYATFESGTITVFTNGKTYTVNTEKERPIDQ